MDAEKAKRNYITGKKQFSLALKTGITCTAYQFRHSYATVLNELGVDIKDAQYLLGNSTIAVTQDIYMHLRDSRREIIAVSLKKKIKAAESESKKDKENGGK